MCKIQKSYSLAVLAPKNNTIQRVTEEFTDITGYQPEEILGKSIEEVFNKLLRSSVCAEEIIETQNDFYIFTKNLEPREVEAEFYFEEGKLSVTLNEKENSRLEEKLPYVEQLYRIEKSGIAVFDAQCFILLKANGTFTEYLSEPYNNKENCIGKDAREILKNFEGFDLEDIWSGYLKNSQSYYGNEIMHVEYGREATYWDISVVPICHNGSNKYFVVNAVDVTERVLGRLHMEARSRKFENQARLFTKITDKINGDENLFIVNKDGSYDYIFEAIIENMSDALVVFDKDGKYILRNNTVFKLGLPESSKTVDENFRRGMFSDVDGKELKLEEIPAMRILRGEKISEEILNIKSTTENKYFSVSGTPIFDDYGNFKWGILCLHDITQSISQSQLIKQQKEKEKEKNEILENTMKMKDEFLATITHEFKTPLTVINAVLQTIDSIYANQVPEHVKKHLQRIRINSFRQLRLVNNLLDITRYNSGRFKMNMKNIDLVFVSEAIVKSVDLYSAQKGVSLSFSSDIKSVLMAMDEEKYERILLNLLSNSIKFTPKGKAVYVHISCVKKRVFIKVRDEGIGIPKSKQKLIFERFGQVDSSLSRQAEGTGIGLSLVKALVEGMGGTIMLESEAGKGSTFTVSLPVTKMKRKEQEINIISAPDNRIMQAVAIEFSDIYLS